MAYLRLAVGLRDELALDRILKVPKSVRLRPCPAVPGPAAWLAMRPGPGPRAAALSPGSPHSAAVRSCPQRPAAVPRRRQRSTLRPPARSPSSAHLVCLRLHASCRRGIGDTSIKKLMAFARDRATTLPALLFGADAAERAAGGGAPQLPPLPDRKQLGLPKKAMDGLESFRELVAGLHTAARTAPLGDLLQEIVERVRLPGTSASPAGCLAWPRRGTWACSSEPGRPAQVRALARSPSRQVEYEAYVQTLDNNSRKKGRKGGTRGGKQEEGEEVGDDAKKRLEHISQLVRARGSLPPARRAPARPSLLLTPALRCRPMQLACTSAVPAAGAGDRRPASRPAALASPSSPQIRAADEFTCEGDPLGLEEEGELDSEQEAAAAAAERPPPAPLDLAREFLSQAALYTGEAAGPPRAGTRRRCIRAQPPGGAPALRPPGMHASLGSHPAPPAPRRSGWRRGGREQGRAPGDCACCQGPGVQGGLRLSTGLQEAATTAGLRAAARNPSAPICRL